MNVVVFASGRADSGNTSLIYHLAWKFSELGHRVLAVDMNPQADLSAMFLDEARLDALWTESTALPPTILGSRVPMSVHVEPVGENLGLVAGDLRLAALEDEFSDAWRRCLDGDDAAFVATTAFFRAIRQAAIARDADWVFVDVGAGMGAVGRAGLLAADHVVVPLAHDVFSVHGLRQIGAALRGWRRDWAERRAVGGASTVDLPAGGMSPLGYILLQRSVRLDRPITSYWRTPPQIPAEYARAMLHRPMRATSVDTDPACLGVLKPYQSLMPLAAEARKPIFRLNVADGAVGSLLAAARACGGEFEALARRIVTTAATTAVAAP